MELLEKETEEKDQGSSKTKKQKSGKTFIRKEWFYNYQTYGAWLDGYVSNPISHCSMICTKLLEKLKDLECMTLLKSSPV